MNLTGSPQRIRTTSFDPFNISANTYDDIICPSGDGQRPTRIAAEPQTVRALGTGIDIFGLSPHIERSTIEAEFSTFGRIHRVPIKETLTSFKHEHEHEPEPASRSSYAQPASASRPIYTNAGRIPPLPLNGRGPASTDPDASRLAIIYETEEESSRASAMNLAR
ncbi:hypothetical protein BDW74DRAFT_15361 [Aspergillus multicolor]|uniref:uncharacterized protein n=1 Tax=Aspergillus multicolor TaxID=41759 RepID=UPI003CCD4B10